MVHCTEHIEEHAPLRIVVGHLYLLSYNSLFLFNGLLCEIRILHEIKQYSQRILIILRAVEKIAGLVERGESVAVCTGLCVKLKNVAVLVLKELVFKVMRYSLGNNGIFSISAHFEHRVYRTVFCAEKCLNTAESGHFGDIDVKSALMLYMDTAVACNIACKIVFHNHASSFASIR